MDQQDIERVEVELREAIDRAKESGGFTLISDKWGVSEGDRYLYGNGSTYAIGARAHLIACYLDGRVCKDGYDYEDATAYYLRVSPYFVQGLVHGFDLTIHVMWRADKKEYRQGWDMGRRLAVIYQPRRG